MAKLVAQIYGQALYELAIEQNKVNELMLEACSLKTIFSDNEDFGRFMKSPRVTKEEKVKVIEDSLKGRVSDDMLGFLVTVADKNRFLEISGIFDYFIDSVKTLQGIGTAYVTTPMNLSDIQKEKIRDKVLSTTGFKEVNIDYSVDTSLIGGMIIRIGDRVVDNSVKTRLYDLEKDLQKIQFQN